MFDEVLITGCTALHADTATVLRTIFSQRGTFDVTHMRNGDYHFIIRIEVFGVELFGPHHQFGATFVTVLVTQFDQFVFHDLHLQRIAVEYLFEVFDLFAQVVVFCFELVSFQAGQHTQTHIDNCRGLNFRQ